MRRFVSAICVLVLVLGSAVAAVAAVDDDAVAGLKASPVYIAPGTEDTTPETASKLQGQLRDDDRIVIVMLPSGALSDYQGGAQAYLAKLDRATGNQYIFALAVGSQTYGYSSLLPSGVAPDLMRRAVSVSVNTIETLGTYARNVHSWQAQNPSHPASQPVRKPAPDPAASATDDSQDGTLPAIIGALISILVVGAVVYAVLRRNRSANMDGIRLQSPDIVKVRLERIMSRRMQIHDRRLQELLAQICRDTEEYFRRNTNKRDADAAAFERHFVAIEKVLDKYIDVQNSPRYFDEPHRLMRRGSEAITDFSEFVLASVRRGTRQDLIDFNVDTDILAAQKHA